MRAIIHVKTGVGYVDGDYAIGITNAATGQTSIPPLAFATRDLAQTVVDAIVNANPDLYTDRWPDRDY